jgi:hypothetical protein
MLLRDGGRSGQKTGMLSGLFLPIEASDYVEPRPQVPFEEVAEALPRGSRRRLLCDRFCVIRSPGGPKP